MTGDLFLQYLEKGVEPFLDCKRPCLLFMDNAQAHITLPIAEFCQKSGIVLVMLPANTTQILQPADQIFQSLKQKMTDLMRTAGLLRPGVALGKRTFSSFLRHALPVLSSSVVRAAWEKTGLHPLNAGAIPPEKFVADVGVGDVMEQECLLDMTVEEEVATISVATQVDFEVTRRSSSTETTMQTVECQTDTVTSCPTCLAYIRENPLVKMGKIPEELAEILIMPPQLQKTKRRNPAKGGIILTAQDEVDRLKRELDEKKVRELQKETRALEREAKKEENVKQLKEKKVAKETKKQQKLLEKARDNELKKILRDEKKQQKEESKAKNKCGKCGKGGQGDRIECVFCARMYHKKCVFLTEFDNVYMCEKCIQK